jgi:hypothetical protein
MDVNWKSSGRSGRKDHLANNAGLDPFLDAVAMKMQDYRPIYTPAEPYDIALVDTDKPHVLGNVAILETQVECELSGLCAKGCEADPTKKRKQQNASLTR